MLIKNGRIKELSNLPLPYNIEQISHPDKYIIPGFIDSHTHILGTGMQKIFPEVSGIESLEQLFDIIAAASYLARQYKFLLIYNFQPDKIKEKRYPTQNELDTVIKDYPVLLYRIDGHSGVLNTKGLEEIIAADNKVLENGAELDPYQEPTGVMRGKAYEFTARHFNKKIHPEIRLQAFIKACQLAIQAGVTTLVTMLGTEVDNITCELLLENQVKLPIDVIPFYQTRDINRIQKLGLPRIGGCILVDGSYGSHTAALTEPYADKPDNKGILYLSDQTLEEFYRAADANNLQTAVHAIGDRAIEQVVRVFEKFLKDNQKRHRIEHCELLSDNLIKRIADLGLIACVQPAFEHYWGGSDKMYAERLGLRWQNTNPFQKMIEKGIIIAGGSDAPITPINPLLGIRTATDMRNSENSISLWHALRMFTYNGAYAVKMENQIGSLQLGLKADFVILEHDPLQTANNKIRQAYKEGTLLLNNI
ncbi:MAG: amidohydrolase [Candidatus Latescibacteria bacterium]|nr:amidohydrolase [Candidatus Latescibacterota bacterium]